MLTFLEIADIILWVDCIVQYLKNESLTNFKVQK